MTGNAPLTYEVAAQREDDVLEEIRWKSATDELRSHLWQRPQRLGIAAAVSQHLGLRVRERANYEPPGKLGAGALEPDAVSIQPPESWIGGSFNLCIPIRVRCPPGDASYRVMMRCPLPHKLAEERYPGTVDEKMRCEVASYVWMQEHCPEVPIPKLLGFGFPCGLHFTHISSRPFYQRWARSILRPICALLGLPVPSSYVRIHEPPAPYAFRHGYLLLEYIEPARGRMLSETWDAKRHDRTRRRNLFRGLARIILSVARIPQAHIGSLTFRDNATISLSNRPLSCSTMILENSGASRVMERGQTYPCAEPYISDLLTQHDGRLLAQPNAVKDDTDCRYQLAVHGLLRMISHRYSPPRSQPFALQFTDFHQSNVFVDEDWNITALVDLEWMCAWPLEMIDIPYWITSKGIDEVGACAEALEEYIEAREEFLSLLEEEERELAAAGRARQDALISKTMRSTWESRSNWFFWSVKSVNAMYNIFEQHIRPQYLSTPLSPRQDKLVSRFWSTDTDQVVGRKLRQREKWLAELRTVWEGKGQ